MDQNKQKYILQAFRQGQEAPDGSELAEAMEAARTDAELQAWMEQEDGFDRAFRAQLQADITPPEGLAERIIAHVAERQQTATVGNVAASPARSPLGRFFNFLRTPAFMAGAALVIAVAALLFTLARPNVDHIDMAGPAGDLVRHSASGISLAFYNEQLTDVRAFLAANNAVMPDHMPANMEAMETIGCLPFEMEDGRKVSLICFKGDQIMHFYVTELADGDAWPEASSAQPMVKTFGEKKHSAAMWREGNLGYVLATKGGEDKVSQCVLPASDEENSGDDLL